MGVRRGDIAILSAPGDYGKPRPAVVIQADAFLALESVVVALLTSELIEGNSILRKRLVPTGENGLRQESDVMLDKLMTMPRLKVRGPIGRLSNVDMAEITAALAVLLGM